ncbi:MAG: hypothetical protein M0R48_09780 [Candidatus Omnitrophica bacterium]|nr:hypothetical protein [Candidatus Omnitrophota bacterium]
MENQKLCEYGCGRKAKFQMKNGKWCCEDFYTKCPENRRKNSSAIKGLPKVGHNNLGKFCEKGHLSWNKGQTKETNETISRMSKRIKQDFLIGIRKNVGHPHTEETKKMLSKYGGIKHGSGRGKHGWYKGYWCDSSWELAWVIYNLDHGIKFERNHQGFEYEFEGEKHKYYPDFILDDGTYVEIKSVMDEKNKAKIASFPTSISSSYNRQEKDKIVFGIC